MKRLFVFILLAFSYQHISYCQELHFYSADIVPAVDEFHANGFWEYDQENATFYVWGNGTMQSPYEEELFYVYTFMAGDWSISGTLQWGDEVPTQESLMGFMMRLDDLPNSPFVQLSYPALKDRIILSFREEYDTERQQTIIPLGDEFSRDTIDCRIRRQDNQYLLEIFNPQTEIWNVLQELVLETPTEVMLGLSVSSEDDNGEQHAQGIFHNIRIDQGGHSQPPISSLIQSARRITPVSKPSPGTTITNRIEVSFIDLTSGSFTVTEEVPEGWSIVNYDATYGEISVNNNVLTWSINAELETTYLSYEVTIPSEVQSTIASFNGTISNDSGEMPLTGPSEIQINIPTTEPTNATLPSYQTGTTRWVYEFESGNLVEDGFTITTPGAIDDFVLGDIAIDQTIPEDTSKIYSNGLGGKITLDEGDGITIFAPPQAIGEGGAILRISVYVQDETTELGLGALDSDASRAWETVDGSIATRILFNSHEYLNQWKWLSLYIDSSQTGIMPVIQAISKTKTTTLFIDRFELIALSKEESLVHQTALELNAEKDQIVRLSEESSAQESWDLNGDILTIANDRGVQFHLESNSEMQLKEITTNAFSLQFRYQANLGFVSIDLSQDQNSNQGYELRLEPGVISLWNNQEAMLISADTTFSLNEWYNMDVHILRNTISVYRDNQLVLQHILSNELNNSRLAFSVSEEAQTIISDISLQQWDPEIAPLLYNQITNSENDQYDAVLPNPDYQLTTGTVPLERLAYKHPDSTTKALYKIDPGLIPPNFVHTWVIDVKDLNLFELAISPLDPVNLHPNDVLKIYTIESLQTQRPVAVFTADTIDLLEVDITNATSYPLHNGEKYKRLFLQLETSSDRHPRRFVLQGFKNFERTGKGEAIVLTDDIDYQSGYIGTGADRFQKIVPIPAPWRAGVHTNVQTYPLPNPKDGWYLLHKNITDPSPLFYSLGYYNEITGKLRFYLYNRNMPTNVTGSTVKISLWGLTLDRSSGTSHYQNIPLQGAFFPLSTNPNTWSDVTVPLPKWNLGTWTCVEIPMLYPMAANLSVDHAQARSLPENYYRSLYEEPLVENMRNIRVQLEINSYDYGDLNATLTGQAVGKAIQELSNQQLDITDIAKNAAKGGKEIADAAKSMHKKFKEFSDKIEKSNKGNSAPDGLDMLKDVAGLGSSIFTGGFSTASAVYSFVSSIFGNSQPEPLQLSIELDLDATIKGSVNIPHHQGPITHFYLPGKFSIEEAANLGFDPSNPDVLAAVIPRYDRTLGLFGYQYNPGEIEVGVIASATGTVAHPTILFPAKKNLNVIQDQVPFTFDLANQATDQLDKILPVIYNEYAEITLLQPTYSIEEKVPYDIEYGHYLFGPSGMNYNQYEYDHDLRWYFDIAWQSYITPEPDDTSFPQFQALTSFEHGPSLYLDFVLQQNGSYNVGANWWDAPFDPVEPKIQIIPTFNSVPSTYTNFSDNKIVNLHNSFKFTFSTLNDENPPEPSDNVLLPDSMVPFDYVMFHWDIPYYYYSRTRQLSDGSVPREFLTANMKSPITLHVSVVSMDPYTKQKTLTVEKVKGELLKSQ